jgi:hypothetical protein
MKGNMKERRAFPRYPITFPIIIGINTAEGKLQFNTECVDVSRSSIQISCESQVIEVLLAQDEYPHTAQMDFRMPGDKSNFSILGQVVTHRRLAQNHYYLVLVFSEFLDGSDEQLAEDLKEFEPSGFKFDAR